MTSVLNFGSSSSSNTIPSHDTSSLFSNPKLATTFIIQPPSSSQPQSHTLLTKRCKPAELGDLLMKKIKSKTGSDSNSNQPSPMIKENSEDNLSNCLESTSMIEEINSPSTKSFYDETEINNAHRMLEGVLIPQRSISTPLINTFNLRHAKADAADNHRRVQHALEVLQKKMMMEQQASLLKEILFKCQAIQEPLIIPPLMTASDSTPSPLTAGKSKKNQIKGFDDEDLIFGPVEYPLLSMAPPGFGGDLLQKEVNLPFAKTSSKGLFGSLAVTRAETQRSDSDDVSSCDSEESGLNVKRRRSKKTVNVKKPETGKGKKGDKGQGKEKTKTKKQK